eukprot:6186834-Pleurochrysis_carterae.AAC.1
MSIISGTQVRRMGLARVGETAGSRTVPGTAKERDSARPAWRTALCEGQRKALGESWRKVPGGSKGPGASGERQDVAKVSSESTR